MNYRHAFHAGGIADCFKHAVLVALIEHLKQKQAPFRYIDTHAGIGLYDPASEAAGKTGEYQAGFGRLAGNPPPSLAAYVAVAHALAPLYPGSPAIARAMLRAEDHAVLTELHPEDAGLLRRAMADDRRIAVHNRDGYTALKAFLPPPEKRGLVLIDPPFEQPDEFQRLGASLTAAYRRWPTGLYAAWYPVKYRDQVRRFESELVGQAIGKMLSIEFLITPADREGVLNGSGMILINPPWKIEERLAPMLADLAHALGLENARIPLRRLAGE